MQQSIRSKAEEKFEASQRRTERVLTEQEQDQQKLMERTLKLRALRLAKEATDRAAGENK